MIKISPIYNYNIFISEKKEGSIHTKDQARNYLLKHGIKDSICYFHHQHQAHRFWHNNQETEQKILADAVLTSRKNICLSMSVADCFPVILTVENSHVFVLIHAGWKPLLQNILELTILEMQYKKRVKSEQITAWIGPGIHPCCYYFKDKPIQADLPDWGKAIVQKKGIWRIDLALFIQQELLRLGLNKKKIVDYNQCTFCQSEQYFSHQRSLKTNEKKGHTLVAVSKKF